ncbi:response regulator transcription factor [Bacillota bacterium]
MLKIVIADDQVLFRNMLGIILTQEPSFEVVGSAGNGEEALRFCRDYNPDIVLMDIRMPEKDGIYALLEIKKQCPSTKVIMLTTFEEEDCIYTSCTNSADGYLLKDTKPEVLISALKCVSENLFVMHSSVQKFIQRTLLNLEKQGNKESQKEERYSFDSVDLDIIKYISMGKNNAEIAQNINYAEGTVKNRISRMLVLTSLKDRTQLAIFALQNKII